MNKRQYNRKLMHKVLIKKEKNSSLSVLVRNIEALKKMPEGTTNTAYYCHFWEMEF